MKRILVSLLVFILTFALSIEVQAKRLAIGAWGSPVAGKFTTIGNKNPLSENSDFAFLLTLRAGFMIQNFIIGGSTSFLVNNVSYDCKRTGVSYGDYSNDSDGWGGNETEACNDKKDPQINFAYGGVLIGYAFPVSEIITLEITDLFGVGYLSGGNYDFLQSGKTYPQKFFINEPEVSIIIVLKKFCAISMSMSYRISHMLPENKYRYYSSSDLSGPAFGLEFRFGWFDYKKLIP